jgi:protein-ribulosamine 3-kinase
MAVSESLLELLRRVWISDLSPEGLQAHSLGGGCINEVLRLEYPGAPPLIAKSKSSAPRGFFAAEARGLQALDGEIRRSGTDDMRVPRVLGWDSRHIVMEYIPSGRPPEGFHRRFGRALALLHRAAEGSDGVFGDDEDNFIGLTVQSNSWPSTEGNPGWPAFFAERRLGFQLELAGRNGLADSALSQAVERVMSRLDNLLPAGPPASVLHGDLWGGNYLCDGNGRAVLIDPAVYRGHGEADLAMTELFGGFSAEFYRGYREVIPDDGEYRRRREAYNLYHLLNHLNLFGGGYYGSVLEACRATGL